MLLRVEFGLPSAYLEVDASIGNVGPNKPNRIELQYDQASFREVGRGVG